MSSELKNRILRNAAALRALAEKLPAAPKTRTALDDGGSAPKPKADTQSVAPVVNHIDKLVAVLDKQINNLLTAISNGNEASIKSMILSVVSKIQEMESVAAKRLAPLMASKSEASQRQAKAIRQVLLRGKNVKAKADAKLKEIAAAKKPSTASAPKKPVPAQKPAATKPSVPKRPAGK